MEQMDKEFPNPFKIEIAQNEAMGGYDVILQVGGMTDNKQAKQFADMLAAWMIEESGWVAKVQ